ILILSLILPATSLNYVIYADTWHPSLPNTTSLPLSTTSLVTHLNLAFAPSNNTTPFIPAHPLSTLRALFPSAKINVAIGGWGDTSGFSAAAAGGTAGIRKWADAIGQLVTSGGYDGVDIDWEYPGGNGADYVQVPNSHKVNEIAAFPAMLRAVREVIGKEKVLSIAVPGKKEDMIAFTDETVRASGGEGGIWGTVDVVNVMAYDLMNRRDKVTGHHSSVAGAERAVRNYLELGAPREKVNLGFAWYAKYFATKGDCARTAALGCAIVEAEDPVTGEDTLTSGAWTFETGNMRAVDGGGGGANLPVSYDGTCGAEAGTRCATGCCSQYGMCGVSKEHCGGACQHAFGSGCTGKDVAASWQLAAKNGVEDEDAGGQYYFDARNQLFWTWDTPATVSRKLDDIVRKHNLGGVMAWSLGEDSFDWSHVKGLADGVQAL
ncbi:carbohydrate-binding module family 18 protein, partial [Periconia macrospinosa]